MNISYLFFVLNCALASIILLRQGLLQPEVLIVQYKANPGLWCLPCLTEVNSAADSLAVFKLGLNDQNITVKGCSAENFDYKIVYKIGDKTIKADPAIKDPIQETKWVSLSGFLNGQLWLPVLREILVARRNTVIIDSILEIFPAFPRPVVPAVNVAPDSPNGSVLVTRLNGYGDAEVLVDSSIDGINIPIVNVQMIQTIFQCSQLEYNATQNLHICRIDYQRDGGLNAMEKVENVLLSWVSIDSVPFFKYAAGPKGMEDFLKRLVLDAWSNINPDSNHGCQSKVAVLRGTKEYYFTSTYSKQLQFSSKKGIESLERHWYNPNYVGPGPRCHTVYSFVEKDTFKAAVDVLEADPGPRLMNPGPRVMVVNFANNIAPGGGYLAGANAQEEDLFRCSNLPWILGTQGGNPDLYPINGDLTASALYNSKCIIMRDRSNGYAFYPEKKIAAYSVSVCSIAAFDINNDRFAFEGNTNRFTPDGERVTKERIHLMFQMAIEKNVDTLILGAFGCGAFGNNPYTIRRCFEEIMRIYNNRIPHVQFAVIAPGDNKKNLEVFSKMGFPQ